MPETDQFSPEDVEALKALHQHLSDIGDPRADKIRALLPAQTGWDKAASMARDVLAFPQQVNLGATKKFGSTIYETTSLINKGIRTIPGAARLVPPMPPKPAWLQPEGTGENIGGAIEQGAEFLLPASKIAQGAKLLEAAKAAGKIPAAVEVAGKMLLEGLSAGTVGTAQTGSVKEGAQVGAFGAAGSGVAQGVASGVKRLAPGVKRAWNATEQAAIDFLESNGVKLSFGQKTGVEGVRRAEQGLVNTPGAMTTAQKFFQKQEGQVASTAKSVASSVAPAGESTSELGGTSVANSLGKKFRQQAQNMLRRVIPAGESETAPAGENLIGRIENRIAQAKEYADKKYGQVRKTVEQPRNTSSVQVSEKASPLVDEYGDAIKTPVMKTFETATDISGTQSSLRPIYEELSQAMPEFQRQSSPGFAALKQIVDGPTVVDALTADRNLSAVKALLREGGGASKYLNSQSKRLAAMTVQQLSKDFENALERAGGDALSKLQQGRKAVARYHDVAELLGSFPRNAAGDIEPAALYERLMGSGDRNIELLSTLKQLAPKELTELGHTFLHGMAEKAGQVGSKNVAAEWDSIGPSTKKLLFGGTVPHPEIEKLLGMTEFLSSLPKTESGSLNPVGVYDLMMSGKDRHIGQLRTLFNYAPTEAKELGHTFMEGLMNKATGEGGFARSAGLLADWNKLGPETKRMMFGPAGTEAVDKLLLGAKLLTRDFNPSGSAKALTATLTSLGPVGVALGTVFLGSDNWTERAKRLPLAAAEIGVAALTHKKLANLLLSKQGGQLLNRGLSMNPNSPKFTSIKAALNELFVRGNAAEPPPRP